MAHKFVQMIQDREKEYEDGLFFGGIAQDQKRKKDKRKAVQLQKFNEGENFDVRYYAIDELIDLFESTIGLTKFSVDCFFGLNVRPEDRDIVDLKSRAIISLSETVRKISQHFTRLQNYADSVFLHSKKAP